jgi:hypothetical protein
VKIGNNSRRGSEFPMTSDLAPKASLADREHILATAQGLLLTSSPSGQLANDALGILVLLLTDRCRDSANIEVVRPAEVLS